MNPLADVIATIIESAMSADSYGGRLLRLTDVTLDLPLEYRLSSGAGLQASLPRTRLVTGFQVPLGRIRLSGEVVPA